MGAAGLACRLPDLVPERVAARLTGSDGPIGARP